MHSLLLGWTCNSLLSGCSLNSPKSFQLIQNTAVWALTEMRKLLYISPLLTSYCWLPVKSRAEFKILFFTCKIFNNLSPSDLKELLVSCCPNRSLHSQTADWLVFPRLNKSRMGGRSLRFQTALSVKPDSSLDLGDFYTFIHRHKAFPLTKLIFKAGIRWPWSIH